MQAASAGRSSTSLSGVNVGKFSDAGLFGTKPLISQDAATSLVDKFVNRPQTLGATPQGTSDLFDVSAGGSTSLQNTFSSNVVRNTIPDLN